MKRPEKKSESLEIRLPFSQKQAFMEACRERGVTASDVLRQFIADDLAARSAEKPRERPWVMTLRSHRLKAAASAAASAMAAAIFGSSVSFADNPAFDRFDKDDDGLVSYDEFIAELEPGRSGAPAAPRPTIVRRVGAGGETVTETRAPAPPEPASFHQELFTGLDRDGSAALSRGEFDGEGRIVRRTEQETGENGGASRTVGIEVFDYDLTERGSVSIAVKNLRKSIGADASEAERNAAFEELEAELERMTVAAKAVPPPPKP
jgi:hypothetical protein